MQSENANIPAGFVDLGSRSFSLKTSGSYESLDQVRDTVVASVDGRIVRIRDVAEVNWNTAAYSYTGRFKGKRAVFVTANQKDGYNILDVRKRVMATTEQFASELPRRIKLEVGFDQSQNVRARLNRLYIDFGIAISLVLITLLPLGLRAAGIVMVSIPLSLSFGLACLYFMGYSLNQLSIAGFVVALGLLVDDSIVVVENIARHMRMGHSRVQAALAGTRQIFVAILGCTATLIFAFLPLLALPGTAGKFIRVLPMAVVATIIGSLLLALFIIPFVASRVLKEETKGHENQFLRRVMAVIHNYYRPALALVPGAAEIHRRGGARRFAVAVRRIGAGARLQPVSQGRYAAVPDPGASRPVAAHCPRPIARCASSRPNLRRCRRCRGWFANLGHGNPQIYYNHIQRNDAANYAEVFVQLHEYDTDGHTAPAAGIARTAGTLPGRAHLCEGIRQRSADLRAHLHPRHRQ